jgi:hypothetical protein
MGKHDFHGKLHKNQPINVTADPDDRSKTEIVRSNSALGMDVCQYLCYSVQEDALCLTD